LSDIELHGRIARYGSPGNVPGVVSVEHGGSYVGY
jgi:hypothetical protein